MTVRDMASMVKKIEIEVCSESLTTGLELILKIIKVIGIAVGLQADL